MKILRIKVQTCRYSANSQILKILIQTKKELPMSDLDIIVQIEQRIGKKLEKLDKIRYSSVGYQLNAQQQVIGLELYGCKLKELPKEIGQLRQLQTLYLGNSIIAQRLGLSSNQLTQLPKEIAQLQQLQELYLRDNQLTQLPKEIGQLQQLQTLDLMENQLTQLPKEIGQLQQLQTLSLSSNQLTQLPKEISQLQQLQRLNLGRNQLTQLPKEIGQLQQLQTLSLHNNQLTQFPKELLKLNLEVKWDNDNSENGIHVKDNPFEIPPVEIVKQGRQAIVDYYKELRRQWWNSLVERVVVSVVISVVSTVLSTSIIYYLFGSPETATFAGLMTAIASYYLSSQQKT